MEGNVPNEVEKELDEAMDSFVMTIFRDLPKTNGIKRRMAIAVDMLLARVKSYVGPE